MSSAVTGKDGLVKFPTSTEVTEIRNWNLSRPMETPDATSMSSNGWGENKSGIKRWSGDFETINFVDLQGQSGVGTLLVGAAATASTPTFTGTMRITDAPVAVQYDDTVAYKHTFIGHGPITTAVS